MVELAFPILVIKTFNNWLLKFIGNLVSVLSVVVPHCRLIYRQWGLSFNDNIHSSIVNLPISFKKTPLLAVASDSNPTTIGIISIGNTQIKITDNNTGTTTRINYLVFGV